MGPKFPVVSRRRFEAVRKEVRSLTAKLDATNGRLQSLVQDFAAKAVLPELADVFAVMRLLPIATCRNKADWDRFCASLAFRRFHAEDEAILARHRLDEEWDLPGYSFPARRFVNFKIDNLYGNRVGRQFFPNVRERIVCPVTNLNNRQRLMAALVAAELADRGGPCVVYFTEQVTSIFKWICSRYVDHRIVGSEYLGDNLAPGQIVEGVRHEDIHRLSFADASIDVVVSTDVMEHVPVPSRGFAEVARVLRPGGRALMTFPFDPGRRQSLTRAEVVGGGVAHRLEPVYHGNPVSSEGSLVFTDFGWDVLDMIRAQNFQDVALEIYHSTPLGNVGAGILFNLTR